MAVLEEAIKEVLELKSYQFGNIAMSAHLKYPLKSSL